MTLNSSTVSAGDAATATQYNNLRKDVLENTGDYGSTTGAANAYVLAMDAQITSLVEGQIITFKANFTNTGAPTINVNSIGAKTIVNGQGVALGGGEIISGRVYCLMYDGVSMQIINHRIRPDQIVDTTYPAGESMSVGNTVFTETRPTTAQATTAQKISDVAGSTRIALPVFGSGVAGTTLKLNLAKVLSPSVDLGIRIETDNGSGDPSGTLFHANATATITPASLTTSLVDTTVTLGGSITIPLGQKCHIVLFQGTYASETINVSNHYSVGYSTNHTTTRTIKKWTGSVWGGVFSSVGSTSLTLAGSSPQDNGISNSMGLKIIAVNDIIINTITKAGSCTATRCYIKNEAGTILDTMTFAANIATPTAVLTFTAGTSFRVEVDATGSSFTNRREQSPTAYPQVGTNMSFTSNSMDGTDQTVGSQNNSILTVNTGIATLVSIFPYTTSNLFSAGVLSKTSATYSYKIDFFGISQEAVTNSDLAIGRNPTIAIEGIDSNQSGMTLSATQFLSNTAGAISSSAGGNSRKIGKAISDTKIKIVEIPL